MNKKVIIFDMDGVIIDSEPLWQAAQHQSLFAFGVEITPEDCERETMGKRIDEIASIWCNLFQLEVNPTVLAEGILRNVCRQIISKGTANVGLYELLNFLRDTGYQIGLATSSNHSVIDAVFSKLQLWEYFDVICSAEDENFGKPSPDVYLTAAKRLGVKPGGCLVIEDSLNGLMSANSASMKTYLVSPLCNDSKFNIADKKFKNLSEIHRELDIYAAQVNHLT
ncbi:hexitol phosphatase HxpB [Vibrio cyclitrophicus]